MPPAVYFVLAVLLVLINGSALCATLFALPGNWIIAVCTALFAGLVHGATGQGIHWLTAGFVILLAVVGEILEVALGAAGAAKQGASRRAMLLSLVGTVAGSLMGAIAGTPIPVLGTILGALGGGALGAFGGAWLGEAWKGTDTDQRTRVGKAALTGRLIGTAAKLFVGGVMFVVAAFDAFV